MDLLYIITVRSVVEYGLPVYFKTLTQTEISRLGQIQYRAAKLVTGALHFSSKEKLNIELGWETIQKRSDILGLNIFHEIHLKENCMPKLDFEIEHELRSKGSYIPFKNLGSTFKLSFPLTTMEYPPKNIQSQNLHDFRIYTNEMKLKKFKHFQKGNKFSNTLLTRKRTGSSYLNQHIFSIGHAEKP